MEICTQTDPLHVASATAKLNRNGEREKETRSTTTGAVESRGRGQSSGHRVVCASHHLFVFSHEPGDMSRCKRKKDECNRFH